MISFKFRSRLFFLIISTILLIGVSCSSPDNDNAQQTLTPSSVASTSNNQAYTCEFIDNNWGSDWSNVINALDDLIARGQNCGEESLLNKKYAAHYNYGAFLEASGELDNAIENYMAAYLIDSNRSEALNALIRLNALPEPTAVSCESDSEPLPDPSPIGPADNLSFARVEDNKIFYQEQPYTIQGVNYYPRNAPWHKFLVEADFNEIEAELDLIKQAGFNTLRLFLWYEPLFTCRPEDAIPNELAFQKVDRIIQLAKDKGFKLILTLNDLPDLIFRPLYLDWERYDSQTAYIVKRYQNESTILAWDLRNEGDLDYGARLGDEAKFEIEDVISWLNHVSILVRENDPNHLVTVGWWGDPTSTEPYVDFLSFHHWDDSVSLRRRINAYSQNNSKPLLLEEIGYHSWENAPQDQRSEAQQAELLREAIEVVEMEKISGWMIWTAFDFLPDAGQLPNFEHFFGLWRTDLSPKPAVSVIFKD